MDASNRFSRGRALRTLLTTLFALGVTTASATSAGASSRQSILATTSKSNGIVLLALGGGILLLGIIGFAFYSFSRRKRRPTPCDEQREALAQAEQAVQYWEAARAHLETAQRGRSASGAANDDASHESLVSKASDGLRAAMKQRDQCQLDLIHCMASGVPSVRVSAPAPESQPFFIPGSDRSSPSNPPRTD